jgi:hypothetical protein
MNRAARPLPAAPPDRAIAQAVADYKLVLKRVLDNRPSGTRLRLSKALGKNRSFISQIANPSYAVPVPAQHLVTIFELCHFSKAERKEFLDAYLRAHPRRLNLARPARRTRTILVTVPDLDDPERNASIDRMITALARDIDFLTAEVAKDSTPRLIHRLPKEDR